MTIHSHYASFFYSIIELKQFAFPWMMMMMMTPPMHPRDTRAF
jgi:hypothetical protein